MLNSNRGYRYRYRGKIHRWTVHRWIIDGAKWMSAHCLLDRPSMDHRQSEVNVCTLLVHRWIIDGAKWMSAHCFLSERNEYQNFQHTSKYPVARVEFTMHGIKCPSMDCKASKNNIIIHPIFNPPVDWREMTWSYIFSKHILFFTAQIIIYRNDFLMFLSEKYFFWNTLECAVLFYPNFDKIIMQLL